MKSLHLRYVTFAAPLVLAACGGGGSSSSDTTTPPPAAPSGLSYPQVPALTVGKAMASVSPAVTGSVTSYSVSPTLPAGLSLNASTGVIAGTPTGVAATANYTVTAGNSSGMSTASIAITVNDVAPSISYASTSLTLTKNVAAAGFAATNSGGTVVTWSIAPALPSGVTFSTTTGTIAGTPTTISAPTTYTVTAANSGGSGTAAVTIGIQSVLVDLGHSQRISELRMTASRSVSVDTMSIGDTTATGTWVLWNYATAAQLAKGTWVCPSLICGGGAQLPVDLAGSTVLDVTSAGLEIRSATDGAVLATVATPVSWWKLATDGSYVCGGNKSGLTVWSTSGAVIATRTGDYSTAVAFAAPGAVQIALGPAGANVIETVALPSGSSTTSPAFQGTFNSWFLDGHSFLSVTSNTVWVYSSSAVQQDIKAFSSTPSQLGGQGSWFWDVEPPGSVLTLYKVGNSATPATSYALSVDGIFVPSGSTIGILTYGTGAGSVFDLSGTTAVRKDFQAPVAYATAYGAVSASQWMLGNQHGVVVDGPSLAGTPRYFGFGAAWSIAGSSQNIAVATASGSILLFDATSQAALTPIPFSSSSVELSSDGTVLAAAGDQQDAQYHTDWSINVYSLPAASLINRWPYTFSTPPYVIPMDITLSASGTVLGQVIFSSSGGGVGGVSCSRQTTAVTGGPTTWTDTFSAQACSGLPVRLSPDATEVAVSNGRNATSGTNIYKDGALVTTVPGWVVGWLDDSRLLVNGYGPGSVLGELVYTGATIYGADGSKLAAVPQLPELSSLQVVDVNSIYDPASNKIYSLTTGAATWTSASPTLMVGTLAGANVVFASGSEVLVEPH